MNEVHRKGSPIPPTLKSRLDRARERFGDAAVCRATGLSQAPFWRALGGGDVHAGTAMRITAGLDALEARDGVRSC